jgi:ABC-type sugar transport system ATPase subunit
LATVSLRQVRKSYDALQVVHGVDLEVAGCELQARLPPRVVRRAGDPVRVAIAPESIHLFDPVTERHL